MQTLAEVSSTDFEAALTPAELRISQIIQVAQGVCVVLLFSVVVMLYMLAELPEPTTVEDVNLINLMSMLHAIVAVAMFGVSTLVDRAQFEAARLTNRLKAEFRNTKGERVDDPAMKCLYIIRSATIIRLAFYDGVALFGLVVCLLAAGNGVLQTYPIYWLNVLSSVLIVAYVIKTFPTTDRLKAAFQDKMKRAFS